MPSSLWLIVIAELIKYQRVMTILQYLRSDNRMRFCYARFETISCQQSRRHLSKERGKTDSGNTYIYPDAGNSIHIKSMLAATNPSKGYTYELATGEVASSRL